LARFALDEAAWSGPWRLRSTGEKALLSLGLLTVAATSRSLWVSLVVLAVAVSTALFAARVPKRTYALAVVGPMTFVAVGAIPIALTFGGRPTDVDVLASLGPVSLTSTGLYAAAAVAVRSAAAMAAMTLLAATTPMVDLLAGLRRLRVPEVLVDIAGLVYRMLFTLMDSVLAVREAQAARLGFVDGRTARRSMGLMAGSVLGRAWQRSRRLEEGLRGRGYAGSLRTLPRETVVSVPFMAVSGLIVTALAATSILFALRGVA
jgi:cobalt/nickel transport system permease protein